MSEALKMLEAHSIAAMELLAVLENGDVDVSEKLREVYAFTGSTATTIAELGGDTEVQDRISELEAALADATNLLEERESQCRNTAKRAIAAEARVTALEDDLAGLDQEHAKQIAQFEKVNSGLEKELERAGHEVGISDDVPTGVVTAHKRLAEGLKKYGDGDYEAALKKLIVAEKTLQKIDGRTFDYD
ncbi:hypothetical protein I6I10_12350 [Corynebacterium glucuronolyticum]|uniref:Uncharacterized protein n=1 Tax=Corynebacterium glucuronolyticum TaxID=39791 RepID=A0A7T4JUU1_9CORY|nr:hypothetical protein [Corynebacterium glucuronolyticum]QQB46217.1 hypothetical protein I6I10_12350 [Corynebacterium glucuronolyticum]WKD63027.1 hypothetical protein CGLUCO_03760 [Corynebacterium glucuronolyticum DSM 44120]SMB85735.1 hypothetical protein SAMN05660745_01523 [Corynebacterium glucuronolyticum]